MYLTWLRTRNQDGPLGLEAYWDCNALLRSRLPQDFGLWCAQQAAQLAVTEPEIARELIRKAHSTLSDPTANSGLTASLLKDMTQGHGLLEPLLNALCDPPPPDPKTQQRMDRLQQMHDQHDADRRARAHDWDTQLRANLSSLRDNTFRADILNDLAHAYFGRVTGLDEYAAGTERLAALIGGDTELLNAVLDAFRNAIHRTDLPDVDTTIDTHSRSTDTQVVYPILAYAVLAGLDLQNDQNPDALDRLSDDLKRTALALLYCIPPLGQPDWHQRWFDQDPELAADVIYRCATRAMSDRRSRLPGLDALDQVIGHDDTKNSVKLRLLRAFPVGGPNKQLSLLDRLLLNVLTSPNRDPLEELVTARLTATSMTVAQRARWLTAGALAFGGKHTEDLAAFLRGSRERVKMLAGFLHEALGPRVSGIRQLTADLDTATLATLIEFLGAVYPPIERDGFITVEIDTADRVTHMISQLAAMPGNDARTNLERLRANPSLATWHHSLRAAAEQQSVVERDAAHQPLTMDGLQRTLSGSVPANAADLAALVLDQLHTISAESRGGATNLWRGFWNVDRHGNPVGERPETRAATPCSRCCKGVSRAAQSPFPRQCTLPESEPTSASATAQSRCRSRSNGACQTSCGQGSDSNSSRSTRPTPAQTVTASTSCCGSGPTTSSRPRTESGPKRLKNSDGTSRQRSRPMRPARSPSSSWTSPNPAACSRQ